MDAGEGENMADEERWAALFAEGDVTGFEELVLYYRQRSVRFALNLVKNYHTAEDITQDCFAEIYVHRSRYDPRRSFKTYLFTIIRRRCIDHLRKQGRVELKEMDQEAPENTEDIVLEHEMADRLMKTISLLKEDYRMAVHLIHVEGFSYKEAAAIMGKNQIQMKVLVYRARQRMKGLMEQEGGLR
jgi:RNA polymerase sigma factor (sigma-70 family)